jgi:hypothetical protein
VDVMARLKAKKKHVFQDPTVEEIVEMEIEVKDPVTGKMIKQKVKVKKLKAIKREEKVFVGATSIIDEIEKNESLDDIEVDTEE